MLKSLLVTDSSRHNTYLQQLLSLTCHSLQFQALIAPSRYTETDHHVIDTETDVQQQMRNKAVPVVQGSQLAPPDRGSFFGEALVSTPRHMSTISMSAYLERATEDDSPPREWSAFVNIPVYLRMLLRLRG